MARFLTITLRAPVGRETVRARRPSSDDGSAMMIELPDRAAVEAMLAAEPYARAGLYRHIEIHDWRFGGRR